MGRVSDFPEGALGERADFAFHAQAAVADLGEIQNLTVQAAGIGNNLNQIARTLNEWHSPYPAMAKELREAAADLAALKYEVLKKVGDAVGNTQAYQL